ncbi:MAG TPA: hypothetical protein VF079_02060 [Sphingomicrobium sp.]
MIAFLLLAAAAQTPDSAAKASETLAASCVAHKFETTVHLTGPDGKPKASKVKICGKPGQSDSDWAATLRDALGKVSADPKMSLSVKTQLLTALNAEIAKLPAAAEPAPEPAPLVAAPALAPPAAPALAARPEADKVPQYSTYAPLPAPKPAATAVMAATPGPPPLPAPKLTFRCMATSTIGAEGPCDLLEREMLLTVRADENVPGGTSLRFLRRGDNRAEVALGALRRGQSQRFSLPPRVCQGVSGSRVEIQVVRTANSGPQVVDTRGPFELRC